MIWVDKSTGRRWRVEQLGRIDLSISGDPDDDLPRRGLRDGAVVLGFLSVDPPRESRVASGAPDDWGERPDVIAALFEEAGQPQGEDDE